MRKSRTKQPRGWERICEQVTTTVDRLFEAHLTVSDLERSIAFYRDHVGLELAHLIPEGQAAFFWVGSRGNGMLGLWAAGFSPQKTTMHVAFATALDQVIAAPRMLDSAGIAALDFNGQPTHEPVVLAWMPAAPIYFHYPDGHLLEYIAMLADEPRPDAGIVAWREWIRRESSRASNTAEQSRIFHARRGDFTMGDTGVVRILAISGSLRSASSNTALVNAALRVAPVGVEISVFHGLADIPPFNPDLDNDDPPAAVVGLRAALHACDAILISSPEYAHGVSGVLKNAL